MLDAGDETAVDTAQEVFLKDSQAPSDLPRNHRGENNQLNLASLRKPSQKQW